MSGLIEVFFVIQPHGLALDWAGPAEAFRIANQSLRREGRAEAFNLRFIGSQAASTSSVGLQVSGIEGYPAHLPPAAWVVLVGQPDEHADLDSSDMRALTHWLRQVNAQLRPPQRLITICAGAVFAAMGGLLAHAKVTTHHLELAALKRAEPLCDVLPHKVFVIDEPRGIYSSAGITTGIDLAVHLIAEVCGEAIAARTAQVLVMPLRRGPDDPELSPLLQGRDHMHAGLHRLQDAICAKPQLDWSVTAMADTACTSPRQLARLFALHSQTQPLAYVRGIRVAVAAKALQAGSSVSAAAEQAGFNSDLQLRRAWLAEGYPGSPRDAQP